MTHGHRHFNAEFTEYRMLGQVYLYTGNGNNKVIEFDQHIDWLMIFSDAGTRYGMYDKYGNQCWLSGNFNSNPSVDNSITSSDCKIYTFTAGNWSVVGYKYCIIALGNSPREVPKQGYAFHKHMKGYDDICKTQCNWERWTGIGAGIAYATIGFNYAVGIVMDDNNDVWFGLSPFAYGLYGSRNFHRQGYNAQNSAYHLNVLNTLDINEEYKKMAKYANELDVHLDQYKGFFIGAYHPIRYIFKGGAYPGHKHETGWDDYNRVVGYVGSYVGNATLRLIQHTIKPFFVDVMLILRQGADNNDLILVKVIDFSDHSNYRITRLTRAGTSVSTVVDGVYLYGRDSEISYAPNCFAVAAVSECNVLNINYIYLALSIINPKTIL